MNLLFYKLYFPFINWLSTLLPKKLKVKILKEILELNNKYVLKNKKDTKKILILLPRCLQYFNCENNIISSIENCRLCGRCKIKNIIGFKEKYNVDIKVASGGELAKLFVEQSNPDFIIAVACEPELILGIKEVSPYRVLAITNIIKEKPCINTDVEIDKIEEFLKILVDQTT